jgi:hypothetical protein
MRKPKGQTANYGPTAAVLLRLKVDGIFAKVSHGKDADACAAEELSSLLSLDFSP